MLSVCAFCYMWKLIGVMVFHGTIINWSGGRCVVSICVFCYMWKSFGVMVVYLSIVNWIRGRSILSICALCYMWKLFGVTIFLRSIVNWSRGYIYTQYMHIQLHVKIMWCNGIPWIYCQLEWGLHVFSVYAHFAICETYLMYWYSIDLLSSRLWDRCILSIYAFCYMWNLFGVMVFQRCIVNVSGRRSILSIYA